MANLTIELARLFADKGAVVSSIWGKNCDHCMFFIETSIAQCFENIHQVAFSQYPLCIHQVKYFDPIKFYNHFIKLMYFLGRIHLLLKCLL